MFSYSGLGSLPGADFATAARRTFEQAPELPYLPELPARGPWAATIGRGLGVPGVLPAELSAGEWRLSDTPGVDQRRARATWRDDLERFAEVVEGYAGPLKVAMTGPWTVAANTGVAHAGRVLADPGARRDLAQSLAEGAGEILGQVQRLIPAAELVLQVDEPSLPAVVAGAVPTPGGFFRHRAVDLPELTASLAWLTSEPARRGLAARSVLHSCAPWPTGWPAPDLLQGHSRSAGFDGIAFDLDELANPDWDALAGALDAGAQLYLGCLPTTGDARPLGVDQVRRRCLIALERLGVERDSLGQVVLTPACGLASWQLRQASAAFEVLRRVWEQVTAEFCS